MEPNPYAAPAAALSEAASAPAPALWNPNAAASWSLLFSPAFGAFLQMRNWQALGEEAKAKASWYWVLATIALFVLIMVVAFLLPESHPLNRVADRSGIAILLAWYFTNGREQPKFVAERFGKTYPRRGWAAPIAIGFAAVLAFIVAFVGLAIVFGAVA